MNWNLLVGKIPLAHRVILPGTLAVGKRYDISLEVLVGAVFGGDLRLSLVIRVRSTRPRQVRVVLGCAFWLSITKMLALPFLVDILQIVDERLVLRGRRASKNIAQVFDASQLGLDCILEGWSETLVEFFLLAELYAAKVVGDVVCNLIVGVDT